MCRKAPFVCGLSGLVVSFGSRSIFRKRCALFLLYRSEQVFEIEQVKKLTLQEMRIELRARGLNPGGGIVQLQERCVLVISLGPRSLIEIHLNLVKSVTVADHRS